MILEVSIIVKRLLFLHLLVPKQRSKYNQHSDIYNGLYINSLGASAGHVSEEKKKPGKSIKTGEIHWRQYSLKY